MTIDFMLSHVKIQEAGFPHKWIVTSDSSLHNNTVTIAYCSTEKEAIQVQRALFNLGKKYGNISKSEPFP